MKLGVAVAILVVTILGAVWWHHAWVEGREAKERDRATQINLQIQREIAQDHH